MKTSRSIRLFQTETEYNNKVSEFKYPTISLVKDVDEVRYMDKPEDYSQQYLTFEALESGTFTLTIPSQIGTNGINSISYSVDNGETWVTTANSSSAVTITTPTITTGNKILWKGNSSYFALKSGKRSYNSQFSSTGEFSISGNIMSLIGGDNFVTTTAFEAQRALAFVFSDATKLKDASNLILPVETVSDYCYSSMFQGCTGLNTAPALPATTLAQGCYQSMFYDCTGLTTAPVLPATTMASNCYYYMFSGCTGLTTAPVLPATTLANYCYQGMFSGCTGLTAAPELPATTMASSCYSFMFYDCTSLTTAPELPATTMASSCYSFMFYDCTSLTTAPVLPATTMASNCYYYMFSGCTGLTTAPVLPATTLAQDCYDYMFSGCSSLNYIKAMFTTTPLTSYTYNWVSGVAATGTFVKNSAAQWDETGSNGIPSGWTVQTAAS